jgi:hypothetical protein
MTKWEQFFLRSVIVILIFTCVAKITSSSSRSPIFFIENDVLPVTNRNLVQYAAVMEGIVVLILVFARQEIIKHFANIWLCLIFIGYRIGAVIVGSQSLCPCMGSLNEKLRISDATAESIIIGLLSYMFLGSVIFLFLKRVSRLSKHQGTSIPRLTEGRNSRFRGGC